MPRPPPPSSLSGRLRQWWHRLTGRPTAPAASDAVDVGRAGGLSPDAAPGPAVVAEGGSWVGGDYAGPAGGRHYRLYRPPVAVTASAPLPLIVMLHGCRQTAEDFAVGTRMNRLAGREGFAVLYPEQSREQNPMGCWNWFLPEHQQRGRGEPEIIAGLTRDVIAAHGLDADRVYVAGLSAGGAMATIVGNEYPDIYAAIAVHSGLRQGGGCQCRGGACRHARWPRARLGRVGGVARGQGPAADDHLPRRRGYNSASRQRRCTFFSV